MIGRYLRFLLVWGLLGGCQFPDYAVKPTPIEEPDVCGASPCQNDGRCIPYEGSFVCLCADGFRGDTCAHNIDDCADEPCQNGGSCVDGVASFTCNCESGFRGDTCEVAFTGCEPDSCENQGTCHGDATKTFCECQPGWDGATCQHNIDDCNPNPCKSGGSCTDGVASHTCACPIGFSGDDCSQSVYASCQAIKQALPNMPDGIYSVDLDGPSGGKPSLEVVCDMTLNEGGWTLVGQEREGDSGTFKFLGVSVGDASGMARLGQSGLIGERFAGRYQEVRVDWSSRRGGGGGIYFRISEEMFKNQVSPAMHVSNLWTSDPRLGAWVKGAGGAILCRGSRSPDVRPGDSSWAIKPQDVPGGNCGCSGMSWSGHGAYYGGHPNATSCNSSTSGWAGVADEGEQKSNVTRFASKLLIR